MLQLFAWTLLSAALAVPLPAQLGQLDAPPPRLKQHVSYASEPQVVRAEKRTLLELRFRVEKGFHVNSHKPSSELQIPTTVEFGAGADVKLEPAEYPAGHAFQVGFDPPESLDVYSEDFSIRLPVVASTGTHELKGVLRYQACDRAACYPPKTLVVDVIFSAR